MSRKEKGMVDRVLNLNDSFLFSGQFPGNFFKDPIIFALGNSINSVQASVENIRHF